MDDSLPEKASPPAVPEEPGLLPALTPRNLIRPALIVGLIVLVVATSVGAFFLMQQKKGRFVVQKKAAPLERIACPGGKSEHIVKTPRGTDPCCPKGVEINRGNLNGIVEITYGFSGADQCLAAAGESQAYSVEIIKCTDNDPDKCRYDSGEKRVVSECKTLTLDAEGRGSFGFKSPQLDCGRYQFDICPAGTGESCYLCPAAGGGACAGVVYGFQVAYGLDNCPGATCVSIIAFKEGTNHLTGLKAGDQVRFVITPSGAVEGAVVRLSKGGVKVADLATVIYEATKYSALYTIPAGGEGNYEALGFVKVGGVWK